MLDNTLRVKSLGSWCNEDYRADLRAAAVLPPVPDEQQHQKRGVYAVVVSGMNGILETVRFGDDDDAAGTQFSRDEGNRGGYIRSVAVLFNGGNPLVVTGGQDQTLRVFDASSGKQVDVHYMKEVVWSVAAADGSAGSGADVICSCDWDGEFTIWNRAHPGATGILTKWVVTGKHRAERCDMMCISADLRLLAACGSTSCWLLPLVDDGRAFDSKAAVELVTEDQRDLSHVAFSADCRQLFVSGAPHCHGASDERTAVAVITVYDVTGFGRGGEPLLLTSFSVPLPASLRGASDVELYGARMALDPRTGLVVLFARSVGFFVYHPCGVQIGRHIGDRSGVEAPMRFHLRDCGATRGAERDDECKSCVLVLERDPVIELVQLAWC